MKCSVKGDFIIILLIILTSNDEGKAFVLVTNDKLFDENSVVPSGVFPPWKNILQDLDSFPNVNNSEITEHRIVKKQMVISDENQLLGTKENSLVDEEKSLSADTSDGFKDNNANIGFNSWIIQKTNEHEIPMVTNDELETFSKGQNVEEDEGNIEAIERNQFRWKRDSTTTKKSVETPDDVDETFNEWTDASHGMSQNKIPPEFKPKPKLMLKIFHLKCKRESKKNEMESAVGKREILKGFKCPEGRRRAFHPAKVYPTRVHPRSFVLRNKKKGSNKNNNQEGKNEGDNQEVDDEESDDESEEEEDQDDEEEDEETEYDDTDEETVSITPKPDRKDSIKEFFKTAKEAVINRARFDDGLVSRSLRDEGGKDSVSPSKKEKDESISEKSKKVLINANIKLDGAISHALKGLLGFRKEKESDIKEGNEKLDNKVEENVNVQTNNNEGQLTGTGQHLLENNQRKKRHLHSLLNKKNKDGDGLEKGGLVSVDSLIDGMNSEHDRE